MVQVYAVETADCEGENELNEAVDRMRDVPEGHFAASEDTHFVLVVMIKRGSFTRRVDELRITYL
jgi:hypothetical protein